MKNNDQEIRDFFQKYKIEIPDEGFSRKITDKLHVKEEDSLLPYFIITGSILAAIITLGLAGFWKSLPALLISFPGKILQLFLPVSCSSMTALYVICPIALFILFLFFLAYFNRIREW